jgi:phospholipid-binding lipoprotein MlaA
MPCKRWRAFTANSTIGIAGLFDPASAVGLPRGSEDFGQTLAVWGWQDSRYVVVPFLGPRTIRDLSGGLIDSPLAPLGYVDNQSIVWGLKFVQLANSRTQAFPFDAVRAVTLDDYTLVRDVWMQRRKSQIQDGTQPDEK